jgi:GTP-binding protein LepA
VLLLVDASQGVEAQTLTVLELARALKRVVIPVVNKIDLPTARVEEAKAELAELLGIRPEEVLAVSGKTGVGAEELLQAVVDRLPSPTAEPGLGTRALVFDFAYSDHQGLIVYLRVTEGEIKKGDKFYFAAGGEYFTANEVGSFAPERRATAVLGTGQIGYVVTGIKSIGQHSAAWRIGDTVLSEGASFKPWPGYGRPHPLVFASLYPESQDDFQLLARSLARLRLGDAALSFEEEQLGALGRGFRAGFLGLLHLEIVSERLRREFGLALVVASPTISYRLTDRQGGAEKIVEAAHLFPEDTKDLKIYEPWVRGRIITPPDRLSAIHGLLHDYEAVLEETHNFGHDRLLLILSLPLRELMRRFFDDLKSVSSGLASFTYEPAGERSASVARLDVLLNDEVQPALARIVGLARLDREAETVVERLKEILPRQLIELKIQARGQGRIIASRRISAQRKDVTGYLYGGDITRKKKLWAKQAKGKKKMQALGSVRLPPDLFIRLIRGEE